MVLMDKYYECRVGRVNADITTFRVLARMGWVATKLYNTALWHSRDQWLVVA